MPEDTVASSTEHCHNLRGPRDKVKSNHQRRGFRGLQQFFRRQASSGSIEYPQPNTLVLWLYPEHLRHEPITSPERIIVTANRRT